MAATARRALALGLDMSTQGLKATAVDLETLAIVYSAAVNYDADLPRFGTEGGFHEDGTRVTSPARMWVAALDELFGRMKAGGFSFGDVAAVSGSGQQHGSVYWAAGAEAALGSLEAGRSLEEQLGDKAFSVAQSPIWADSSTGAQCKALEDALGGPMAVAELTGSRAYERFTGNQIAKIAEDDPAAYAATERISLVSSFAPSLLMGSYASIDYSDAAGMNLMDLRARTWSKEAVEATAPDLAGKLGDIVPSHSVLGSISNYFRDEFSFPPDCQVVAWSGDNPNSVAGLGLQKPGDIGISLGTSDTLFGITESPTPGVEGHLFPNPVDPESFMAMVCYRNGSLTRESVRDAVGGGSWEAFSKCLSSTPPGNEGRVGLFVTQPDITPGISTTGIYRFDSDGSAVPKFDDPASDCRAVIEGQFLSMRIHAASVGITGPKRVLLTGGASQNSDIAQIVSDVFGAEVLSVSQPDSASLGAALRAAHALLCSRGEFVPFAAVASSVEASYERIAEPSSERHAVYSRMLAQYTAAEEKVVAGTVAPTSSYGRD